MKLHATVLAVGLTSILGGCAASQSQAHSQVAASSCAGLSDVDRHVAELYAPGQIERVEPLQRREFLARSIERSYVAGAKLYVPAQQGVSQPYLERVLSCHAAAQTSQHPNDPLRVTAIESIDVSTAGSRFVVSIAGANRSAGKEIWQRARALHDTSSQVEVRQLSATPGPSRDM